ncbi:MAG: class I tRNA ligase family protein, partial [Actinobacteria bacterium]|nr:class I tRNA ligase family protein [Actinomycetota bacterium]
LLAPFTPFVADEIWRNLAGGLEGAAESVHLADYPKPVPERVDAALDGAMQAARDIVSLGRTVRTDARVRTRQPLRRAVVHHAGDHGALAPLLLLVAEELNVKEVRFAESAEELAGWRARPSFRTLGPRLGSRVKEVAALLEAAGPAAAAALARGEEVSLGPLADGGAVTLGPDDVVLTQESPEGWEVAAEGGVTVALDLEVTPELRLEGLAREVIRVVQDARKAGGLEVTDRIELGVEARGDVAEAVGRHGDWIAAETLAGSLADGAVDGGAVTEALVEGSPVRVTIRSI